LAVCTPLWVASDLSWLPLAVPSSPQGPCLRVDGSLMGLADDCAAGLASGSLLPAWERGHFSLLLRLLPAAAGDICDASCDTATASATASASGALTEGEERLYSDAASPGTPPQKSGRVQVHFVDHLHKTYVNVTGEKGWVCVCAA
jgi:hypothetical protein